MKKAFILYFIFLFFVFGSFCQDASAVRVIDLEGYVPSPRLIYPVSEEVTLEGEKPLIFKWSPHESRSLGRRSYDFRIYSGTEMLGPNLIYKETVPGGKHEVEIAGDFFEDRETYTWSLRQIYKGIGKSRRSFNTFRVIK